jgi:hypothetical protein
MSTYFTQVPKVESEENPVAGLLVSEPRSELGTSNNKCKYHALGTTTALLWYTNEKHVEEAHIHKGGLRTDHTDITRSMKKEQY